MIGVILRWLPLSLALHMAVLATTLMLPRERELLPLFVDLTLSPSLVESTIAGDDRSAVRASTASPRRSRGAAGPGSSAAPPSVTARATTSPLPASPVAPSPPVPEAPAPTPTADIPPAAPPPNVASAPSAESAVVSPPASSPMVTASEPTGGGSGAAPLPADGGVMPGAPAAAGGGRDTTAGAGGLAGGGATRGGPGEGGETLALGIPGDDGGAYAGYIALLRRRVQEALTYPSAARRRGMSGTVHLEISVETSGRIRDVLVVRSSSHELLDEAAVDAVRTLRQVPFPPGVRPRPVRVRLPVVFDLR